jgi:VWFA-related protein
MRSDVIRRLVIVSFGLLALALAVRTAGEPQGPPTTTFSEVADVTVVNLEVRVSDKKGRPVSGLTATDFEIYEDGRRMTLSNFYSVQGGAVVGRKGPSADPAEVTGEASPSRLGPMPRVPEPLALVVYVDNDVVRPAGRGRVLRDLRTHLEADATRLRRTAIFVRQAGSVRKVLSFGSDAQALATALGAIEAMPASGFNVDRLRTDTYRQVQFHFEQWHSMEGDPCVDGAPELESMARGYAAQMTDYLGRAMGGLRFLSTVLAAVPGRKAVLYVGEGLEQLPGLSMFQYLTEICPVSAALFQQNYFVYNETDTLRAATDHANANQITLYALQARGLETSSASSVLFSDHRYTPSALIDRIDLGNRQSSFFVLSNETGGKPVLNANRFLDALEGIETDLGTYYSLGYAPPHAGDNRRHAVSIKLLKKRHWRLRFRRGYVDKAPDVQLAERTFGATLFGFEENALGVVIETLDPRRTDIETAERGATVILRLSLDRSKLSLVASEDGHRRGRFQLVMTLDRGSKEPIALRQREIEVDLGPEVDRTLPQRVDVGIDLAPGEAVVGVGVRDEIGGAQSFLRYEISVPPI